MVVGAIGSALFGIGGDGEPEVISATAPQPYGATAPQPYGGSAFQSFPIQTSGTLPGATYSTPTSYTGTIPAAVGTYSPYNANSFSRTPYSAGTTTLPLNSVPTLSPYMTSAQQVYGQMNANSYRSLPQSNLLGAGTMTYGITPTASTLQPSGNYMSMRPAMTQSMVPATTQPVKVTKLAKPASKGDTEIHLESQEGMSPGDTIVIGTEQKKIAGFGSVILDTPLDYDHPRGELVTAMPTMPSTVIPQTTGQYIPQSTGQYIPQSTAQYIPQYSLQSTGQYIPQYTDALEATQEVPVEEEEEPEPYFVPMTIEKPVTKWKTATDVEGDLPAVPQTMMPHTGRSIVPGYHHTHGHPRQVDTDQRYWNTLNEESNQPWPFWVGAGTPAARMEPTWQDGNWYLVAPVDFKGMENMKKQGKWSAGMEYDTLNSVDQAVRELDAQGHLAPLPPPRHWKEHKGCPIA